MSNLEAKIVVLGSQAVGKTSLVLRYVKNIYAPSSTHSTVGASFLTKRVVDNETGTIVRLQIWDTAGQERFRSMSRLYYRGANAGVLCYDVTDAQSFEDMTKWLMELKQNLGEDAVLHVVGTKADLVEEDPSRREVPFETVLAFVEEHVVNNPPLGNSSSSASHSPPQTSSGGDSQMSTSGGKRNSGFWSQDATTMTTADGMCHEISAKDGEGVEEVFRVITRKLVDQQHRRQEREALAAAMDPLQSSLTGSERSGAFNNGGSFRVGRDRRSWMGFPPNFGDDSTFDGEDGQSETTGRKRPRCC
ncbi:MAG: hypothetical protein M1823_000510 [Watsoniomyces obsoletus]|nr:MAG: hypothetical protein M1823_000510 [Watsoniomyces obsoletus]